MSIMSVWGVLVSFYFLIKGFNHNYCVTYSQSMGHRPWSVIMKLEGFGRISQRLLKNFPWRVLQVGGVAFGFPFQERWSVDMHWQKAPRSESQSHCAVAQACLPSAPVLLPTTQSLPFVKIVWLFEQFCRNEAYRKFILKLFKPHKAFRSFPSRTS